MKRLLTAAISSLFPQFSLFGCFRCGARAYSLAGARTYPVVLAILYTNGVHFLVPSHTRARGRDPEATGSNARHGGENENFPKTCAASRVNDIKPLDKAVI